MSVKAVPQSTSDSFLFRNKYKLIWVLAIAILAIGDLVLCGIDSPDRDKVDANGFVSPWEASSRSPESAVSKTTNADKVIKLVNKENKTNGQNSRLVSSEDKKSKWDKTSLRTASANVGSIQ